MYTYTFSCNENETNLPNHKIDMFSGTQEPELYILQDDHVLRPVHLHNETFAHIEYKCILPSCDESHPHPFFQTEKKKLLNFLN